MGGRGGARVMLRWRGGMRGGNLERRRKEEVSWLFGVGEGSLDACI